MTVRATIVSSDVGYQFSSTFRRSRPITFIGDVFFLTRCWQTAVSAKKSRYPVNERRELARI